MEKLTFKNGSVYEGEILDGKPHGKGKCIIKPVYENEGDDEYEGDFVNGKLHGKGKYTSNYSRSSPYIY